MHVMKTYIVVCIFFLGSLELSAAEIPPSLSPLISTVIEMTGKKEYDRALLEIREARQKSDATKTNIQIVLGQLEVRQLLNLEKWDEAERLALGLKSDFPETNLSNGFLVFGQQPIMREVMASLAQAELHDRAVNFSSRALVIASDWQTEPHPNLAGFWMLRGNAQFLTHETKAAIESWEQANQCWEAEKLYWREIEPKKFDKFGGLDRFNPLQARVQVLLLGAYSDSGNSSREDSILANWRLQHSAMAEAHKDTSPELALRIFRRTIQRVANEAEATFGFKGLAQKVELHQSVKSCSALFVSQ